MNTHPSPASLAARVLELDVAIEYDAMRFDQTTGATWLDPDEFGRVRECVNVAVQLAHAVLHPPAQHTRDGEGVMRAAIAHAIEATLRAVDYQEGEGIPREAQEIDYKGITNRAILATQEAP